jgi:hypothetical protein
MEKLLTLSRNVQSKANIPLLAKAMLTGRPTSFRDITGHNHMATIMGIRAEGGKGLWLVKTRTDEYCVREMDGEFSELSKYGI